MLAAFDWGEIQAVFCGGTSLSKGHGVIQRMSEDIDFKLVLPASWSRSQARRKLSACRKELAETMRAADFDLPEAGIVTLDENRYFCFSLGYMPQFPLVPALRAELRLDFTAHTPLLDPVPVQVRPLLAEFMALDAQVVEHQAERDPDDDMLVRHLYDVHERFVSELVWGEPVPFAEARAGFVALAARLLQGLDPHP